MKIISKIQLPFGSFFSIEIAGCNTLLIDKLEKTFKASYRDVQSNDATVLARFDCDMISAIWSIHEILINKNVISFRFRDARLQNSYSILIPVLIVLLSNFQSGSNFEKSIILAISFFLATSLLIYVYRVICSKRIYKIISALLKQ